MNVLLSLYSLKESWMIFRKSIDSLSNQQKKVGLVAAIVFAAIPIMYLTCRCWANLHAAELKKGIGKQNSNVSMPILSDSNESSMKTDDWIRGKKMFPPIDYDLDENSDESSDERDRLIGNKDTPYIDGFLAGDKHPPRYSDPTTQFKLDFLAE